MRFLRPFSAGAAMLPINIKIKNLGKLTDADIRIGKFTVFAGPNNTGKTFASKALYSLLGAMNANPISELFRTHFLLWKVLSKQIVFLSQRAELKTKTQILDFHKNNEQNIEYKYAIQSSLKKMDNEVSKMRKTILSIDLSDKKDVAIEPVLAELNEILGDFKTMHSDFEKIMTQVVEFLDDTVSENDRKLYKKILENIKFLEQSIQKIIEEPIGELVIIGLEIEIKKNILQNFMLQLSSNLIGKNASEITFDIDNTIKFCVDYNETKSLPDVSLLNIINKNRLYTSDGVDVKKYEAHQITEYSRPILYLESSFFWRFKKHLEVLRMDDKYSLQREAGELDFPKYFYDMVDALRRKTGRGNPSFPELFNRLTGEEVLGGKLIINQVNDELCFQEGDDIYPLHLSSVGVANLGMLALLMEYNLLDENTFLFIDEPEANLHPAWQVEMVEALYALSQAGVNVIIATHSADILKWLEVHAKENKDAENIIALNHFRNDGTVSNNGESFTKRINTIQEELADPFLRLYYRGL